MRFSAHRVEAVALCYAMLCYPTMAAQGGAHYPRSEGKGEARRLFSLSLSFSLLGADSITDFDVFIPLEGCY